MRSTGTTSTCAVELAADESESVTLPSRVHAIVLVSKVHKPTLRALAYARATRPSTLEALTVDVDGGRRRGARGGVGAARRSRCPLKVLDSPFREVTRPIIDYVRNVRRSQPARPRDRLHPGVRRRATGGSSCCTTRARCGSRRRLLFVPGVMVARVPWQLASSALVADRPDPVAVGAVRKGEPGADVQEAVVASEYSPDADASTRT